MMTAAANPGPGTDHRSRDGAETVDLPTFPDRVTDGRCVNSHAELRE